VLALSPGHRLHREQAMALLWPDLAPKAALNNLHYALHVARRTLEPSALDSSSATSRYVCLRASSSPCAPILRCGWMSKPSRKRLSRHGAPWSSRRFGWLWICTQESSCQRTATRGGLRSGAPRLRWAVDLASSEP